MSLKYIPVITGSCFVFFLAVFGYFVDIPVNEQHPKRIFFNNAGGAVVFNHGKHIDMEKNHCAICHHESPQNRENIQSCKTCHGVVFEASFKFNHQKSIQDDASCVTCHHFELGNLEWDHNKHQKDNKIECNSCHHKENYIEEKPKNCANCHDKGIIPEHVINDETIPNVADAVHARCNSCHKDRFEAGKGGCFSCHEQKYMRRTIKPNKPLKFSHMYTNCVACHKQTAEKLIPARMDAYHKLCMNCHEKENRGPYGKENCKGCHTGRI